ncbi:MAG TPA: hypothetical protein VLI40_07965 [Gemmatimonadaceae bacterium]|nr:hypothetical protein [Gemmatimonadaceae bacterium]
MRRIPRLSTLLVLAVPGVVWLTACSSDRSTAPAGADAAASANQGTQTHTGQCVVPTQQQITALFNPTYVGQATSGFNSITNDLKKNNTSAAISDMFAEWKYTLDAYYAGQLNGGTSAQTQANVLAFGQSLYCLVGLDGSTLTLGSTPLDPDDIVQVVFPSASDQTVVIGSKHAGVLILGGTLTQPVTISISILRTAYTFPAGPLNTKLDQYGPFFEFKVIPEQTFTTSVVTGACLATPTGDQPPSSVHLAHNVGQGLEILPQAATPFLTCDVPAPQPSVLQMARNGEYGKAVKQLGSDAVNLFSPTTAYALVSSGVGGKTTSFSPFGGVDTAVVVTTPANFPAQPQTAPAGSSVAAAPSALVQTTNGHTPLGGASVTFAVASGGGSVGPTTSSTRTTTLTLNTDANGLATVPNWTLGAGPSNSLTASASFTLPTSISGFPTSGIGVTVSGSPLTFTATSTDVIPYQATGYVYLSGLDGLDLGFEQPAFPTSGWSTGTAAFGSSNLGASCASLMPTVTTTWVNNPSGTTDMLLRKSFTLPAWWTAGLTVGIAIDNDFKAYVDGVNVTPTSATGYDPTSGFVKHEGCATRDSYTFPISVPATSGGSHLLAIRARDRGTAAYVDTRIGVTP